MTIFHAVLIISIFSALVAKNIIAAAGLFLILILPHLIFRLYTSSKQEINIRLTKSKQISGHNIEVIAAREENNDPIKITINKTTLDASLISSTTYGGTDFKESSLGTLQSVETGNIPKTSSTAPIKIKLVNTQNKKTTIQITPASAKIILSILPRTDPPHTPTKPEERDTKSISDGAWKRAVSHVQFNQPKPPKPAPPIERIPPGNQSTINESWLDRRLTQNEIDSHGYGDFARKYDGELWLYRSPQDSWDALAGEAGVAIVKDGIIIKHFPTLVS